MSAVGVRELKDRLSSYLRRVRRGETILVTDRGRPVARIIPAGVPDHIAELLAQGRVTWSGKAFAPPPRPARPTEGPPFSRYVSEDRL
jgi:prevent-host-death family protein